MAANDDDVGSTGARDMMALKELEPVGDSPESRRG